MRAATAGRGPRKALGDRLCKAIGQSDLSPYELARASGVDRSVLSRFVAGKRTITLEAADKLAEALRLRIARA
jgi:plasmid maintenance system antidote protein VapI